MKKVMLSALVALIIGLAIQGQEVDQHTLAPEFVEANSALMRLSNKTGDTFFEITESSDGKLSALIKTYGIRRILFHQSPINTSVRYSFKAWFDWLTPYRYYKFSSTGYTEEDQVESIKAAIENNTEDYYHFCQKMDRNNWFYCQSQPN